MGNRAAGSPQVAGLVDLLYESMLEPGVWPRFVAQAADVFGADSAQVLSIGPLNADGFWIPHRIDRAAILSYEQYYAGVDPWRAALSGLEPNQARLLRGEELVADREFLASEFYNDFLVPLDQRWLRGIQLRPAAARAPEYALCLYRGPWRGGFEPWVDEALAGIGRHLLRVERLGIAAALAGTELRRASADAAFFLSPQGKLIECNAAGEALIDDGTVVAGARTLGFASQAANLWLHGLVSSSTRLAGEGAVRRFSEAHDDSSTLEIELIPLHSRGASLSMRVAKLLLRIRRRVPDMAVVRRHALAVDRFGFTRAEADVVRRLAAGSTVAAIAQARECSRETVRSHLKSAKRKAGVNRQVDLLRIVMQLDDGIAA